MVTREFCIAGLRFALNLAAPIRISPAFQPFLTTGGGPDITVDFRPVAGLPEPGGKELYRDLFRTVYRVDGGFRKGHLENIDRAQPYALSDYDWETGRGLVQYLEGMGRYFTESENSFSHIGFEEILMSRDRLILHASAVATPLGGVLFSGPSGIGKSTQAELWCRYAGGTLLNGDRPILHREDGVWQAWGSPYAGSSGCHVNKKIPIRAIVMLEQGTDCRVRQLGGMQAFCRLYAQTTFNSWDPRYVERAAALLESLAAEVPVYHYCCTKEEESVRVLREALS